MDYILSLEEIVERMLTIFRIKYNIERFRSTASAKAPLLSDEHFIFGNPTIIPQAAAIVAYPEEQDEVDSEGSIVSRGSRCCTIQEGIITIIFYVKEYEQARGHRRINQMGEVIKRMLLRNKGLVFLGAGLIEGLEIETIEYGEVSEAYEGERVFYPNGTMQVRVTYSEFFEEDLA